MRESFGLFISTSRLPAVAGPVLVVAAEALQRHRMATRFGRAGFRVAVTSSSDEALVELQRLRPRAVIVATPLPGTDWSVLATLARPATVVVVSGDAWQSAKAHALGCDAVERVDDAVSLVSRQSMSAPPARAAR